MKTFLKKYRHAWLILAYLPIYLLWFLLLEEHVVDDYHIIESPMDDHIPFVEQFIIPYLLWFPFIAISVLFFIFRDKAEFYRLCGVLISGMTVFLLVSTLFPNGLALRPDLSSLGRDNLFLDLVAGLHKADTSTNVCPSIHVYNSLAVCFALFTSAHLKGKKLIKAGTLILTILICMSTVFLKQHSVIDVFWASVLFLITVPVFYGRFLKEEFRRIAPVSD
ncbi:MAG: phosphatase PAP2 family protein [Lachnospiraceae bacterium]|nr:phosphatase PAP2 family protein [Lachnospiraceae bacterium]